MIKLEANKSFLGSANEETNIIMETISCESPKSKIKVINGSETAHDSLHKSLKVVNSESNDVEDDEETRDLTEAKTTIRNEGNIDNDTFDRDEIQFDESEHVELKKTMMIQVAVKMSKLMERENMWKLKSGRFVEEELYKLGLDMKFEHASYSFIVNVDDEAIKQHFNKDEQVAEGSPKIINEPDKRFDAKYDKNLYHDLDYIRFALYAGHHILLEFIRNCNAIVDQGFSGLNGISVVRGESTSLASADRKNAQRIMPERRNMGHRGDLL
ncbi:hypothetical protein RhiirA4_544643 [Rhizophagus irregularis]|uniref:Uncharacterized protein n=1 Tax=Rhizophagus irregularis TaxID=588596 RepID=A0A2I1GPB3_9GLOM|nr:hypothetical protein RhiirA4_544643 [Rhizophagus irregularis]